MPSLTLANTAAAIYLDEDQDGQYDLPTELFAGVLEADE